MIEFAILFGLGFLTATLMALLLVPVILRRVIWFTEKRLHATMPLSPQEIRAQKDMARAFYAAETAKVSQSLKQESEKAIKLQLQGDALSKDIVRLQSDKTSLKEQIETLNSEAAELRSRLHREEDAALQLKVRFSDLENVILSRDQDIETLEKRVGKLLSDIDNLKLDLATSGTTAESMQARIASLRDERDMLRQDLKTMTQRARDAQMRLEAEEHKSQRLEERLMREQTLSADRETLLERRGEENARLRDKLNATSRQAQNAAQSLRLAGLSEFVSDEGGIAPDLSELVGPDLVGPEPADRQEERISLLTDSVRARSTALTERLARAKGTSDDPALREDIASIAARMVALTAIKEGKASPIPSMLSAVPPKGHGGHQSLAERITDTMNLPS